MVEEYCTRLIVIFIIPKYLFFYYYFFFNYLEVCQMQCPRVSSDSRN